MSAAAQVERRIAGPVIELASAWLCSDCNAISDVGEVCARCGSRALLSLKSVLDRDHQSDQNELRG